MISVLRFAWYSLATIIVLAYSSEVYAEVLSFKALVDPSIPVAVCDPEAVCEAPEALIIHNFPNGMVTVVGSFASGRSYYLQQGGLAVSKLQGIGIDRTEIGLSDFVQGGFLMLGAVLTILTSIALAGWQDRRGASRARKRLIAVAGASEDLDADALLSLLERVGASVAARSLVESQLRQLVFERDSGAITRAEATKKISALVREIPRAVLI